MSRCILSIVLVIFLSSLILSHLDMPPSRYAFPCVNSCGKGSRSQRGLSLHQLSCKVYKQEQSRAFQEMTAQAQIFERERLLRISLLRENSIATPPPALHSLHGSPGNSTLDQSQPVCLFP